MRNLYRNFEIYWRREKFRGYLQRICLPLFGHKMNLTVQIKKIFVTLIPNVTENLPI